MVSLMLRIIPMEFYFRCFGRRTNIRRRGMAPLILAFVYDSDLLQVGLTCNSIDCLETISDVCILCRESNEADGV